MKQLFLVLVKNLQQFVRILKERKLKIREGNRKATECWEVKRNG